MNTLKMPEKPIPDGGGESLKLFQLTTAGIKEKSSKDFGLAISKYIASTCSFSTGYYFQRNSRFIKNRNYANGRIDVEGMFKDRFRMNAKQNYIALNWNTLQLVNRIISGLVSRWMQRGEKIQIKAIDNLSQTEKKEQYNKTLFYLQYKEQLLALEQESGVQIIPNKDELPEDKEALNIWRTEQQQLPEEILNEMACNDVLASNGYFDVMKEKLLHDGAEVLFFGTETVMDSEGVIRINIIRPEDAIYSYSEQIDMRDTTWRGHIPSLKISQIRRQWGKEFNHNNPLALTEKEIWEKVVPTAKEFQYQSNITWQDTWELSFLRPYDEWNARVMIFEIKTVDSEPFTVTKSKKTGTTYIAKGNPKTKSGKEKEPSEAQTVLGDSNWNIYRGVFMPDSGVLLEWGIKKNMIRPQDPREIGNCEFSFSFVMPQNYLMRNLAIPEKIEAAIDGMMLALLKMQQVMARLVPSGWAIDETALQNIDYGLGNEGNKAVDHTRQFFQTGLLYYNGIDEEGRRIAPPITELANAGFSAQMEGLIRNYQFNYQALKDELGEDPNLISAALQPRVTSGNVEASQTLADFATDYIYRGFAECMKQTARKISCLIKDSIQYGSEAYRKILQKDDVAGRQFTADIRFLPTQIEVQQFEAILNQTIAATPDMLQYLDPFKLLSVAKEDVKLARMLFRQAQKRFIIHQQEVAQQNQQATIEGQIKSAQVAEEEKRATKQMEMEIEERRTKISSLSDNQSAVVNMVANWLKPNSEGVVGKIPDEFKPIVDGVFQNILIGAIAQTDEQKEAMIAKMQAAQQQQQQTQGEEPTEGMPDNEEQDEMEEQPETEEQPDSQQQPEMVA